MTDRDLRLKVAAIIRDGHAGGVGSYDTATAAIAAVREADETHRLRAALAGMCRVWEGAILAVPVLANAAEYKCARAALQDHTHD